MDTDNSDLPAPRWLHGVMCSDRAWSASFLGWGFLFAPIVMVIAPYRPLVIAMWVVIAVAAVWLALAGVLMAAGLAITLRSGRELPDRFWRSIIDYPAETSAVGGAKRWR
jgi:hypothetical protein